MMRPRAVSSAEIRLMALWHWAVPRVRSGIRPEQYGRGVGGPGLLEAAAPRGWPAVVEPLACRQRNQWSALNVSRGSAGGTSPQGVTLQPASMSSWLRTARPTGADASSDVIAGVSPLPVGNAATGVDVERRHRRLQ